MFVHYSMENTSTRTDEVNHLTINVHETMSSNIIGTARLNSFTDIYLELPEVQGRYQLRKPALRQLEMKGIHTLEQLYRLKWLISDGAWILKNLKKVTA